MRRLIPVASESAGSEARKDLDGLFAFFCSEAVGERVFFPVRGREGGSVVSYRFLEGFFEKTKSTQKKLGRMDGDDPVPA